jgi:outer membrane protein assembly factor BamA
LDATWLNRANYFSMVSFSGRISYSYQARPTLKHEFTPFRLDYDKLLSATHTFDSIMTANPALYISMRDQFVPSMMYRFTYSSRRNARNPRSFIFEVKESGNVMSGLYAAFGKPFHQKDKMLFGVPFAQYLRFSAEFREEFRLTPRTSIATRIGTGVIYSYGNSTAAPYNDLFCVGGANSIRAFTVRGIGPGSYTPGDSEFSYIDQMGDFKIELNAEYRFPIVSILKGAIFLDAGNVWLLNADENRRGGTFDISRFGKDLALGTGAGLRLDLDFLILRFDVGVGIHAPYNTGKSGYYNMPRFKDSLGYHFAVGYPF